MTRGVRELRKKDSEGLRLENFRQIACDGFADSSMRTSQAMAWYKGHLFVGTGRGYLRPLGRSAQALEARPGLSRLTERLQGQSSRSQEAGTQIWRLDPRTDEWKQVYVTPWVVGTDGREHPRDRSARARAIFKGKSDPELALYFGVGSLEGQATLIRSIDGEMFE